MSFKLLKSLGLVSLIGIVTALLSCGSDDQFTNKLVAQPFVSKLFGQTTKTIALSTNEGDQIAWMGLEWSGDYKFFQIERVNNYVPEDAASTSIVPIITVSSDPFKSKPTDGIKVSGPLNITLSYKPLKAIETEGTPHKAYLLLAYNKPSLGIVRIELLGMTKGLCDPKKEKCNFTSTLGLIGKKYVLKDDQLQLYVCHPDITRDGLANDTERKDTRVDPVIVKDDFVFYLNKNETAVHIVRDDEAKLEPTVPLFEITVPAIKGVPDVEGGYKLPVELRISHNVECPLDKDGNFRCEGVELLVGGGSLATVDPFVVTNGTETPLSDQCPDFGEILGDQGINDDAMTLVAWSIMTANAIDTAIDAVIVAVLPLEVVQ